jgi:hypothetical protein
MHPPKVKLLELRSDIAMPQDARGYCELFDEFVRECEFGLALHAVCDYLLEPLTPAVGEATTERIQALHESMKILDDCVAKLRQKARGARAVCIPTWSTDGR